MDGTVVKRADFPPPEVMGGPSIVALRPVVYGALAGGGVGAGRHAV